MPPNVIFSAVSTSPARAPSIKEARAPAPVSEFAADVIAGFSRVQKELSPKYFYDAEGSRLFEEICTLDEYYPTRTELALLGRIAGDVAARIPRGALLVEFGSGASLKTRLLLDAAPHVAAYTPIDISPEALAEAADAIRASYPNVDVAPLAEDFTRALELPAQVRGLPPVGFFPGSTIGNFTASEAVDFLHSAKQLLGHGAEFVVGIDLVKPIDVLKRAYDDARGVTAAFNKNVLVRMNRELGADFDLYSFAHEARWNPIHSRVEMHLRSLRAQTVNVAGRSFEFAEGETIHTENSHKFTRERFAKLAEEAGWRVEAAWTGGEEETAFGVVLLVAV